MKVYFETYGCTMNQGDTEIMKGLLNGKVEVVEEAEDCDIAVINSCGVIQRTENKVLRRVSFLKESGKKVIVAGCLPKISPQGIRRAGAKGALNPGNLSAVVKAIDDVISGKSFFLDSSDGLSKAWIRKRRGADKTAIIPISEGCLGSCSYCGTRFARGKLHSYAIEDIKREAVECLATGYRELKLTAQDTAAYGRDFGRRLPNLLREICTLRGNFRVRVGMMNPRYTLDILDELINAFHDEKIYKFFHIPVQSGDDRVLAHMNRGYRVKDFLKIVTAIRESFEEVTLSTDIIVGYPIEDETSFQRTYALVEDIKPDILNITRYSPRPSTKAAEYRDLLERYKKERSRRLTALHKKIGYEINNKLIGREYNVLITETGKNGSILGRTDFYKQIVLKDGILGEFKKIKIKKAKANYLIGN